jgi:complex iron-sulfur molybdoenzyme family reductase subunit gamma
MRALLAAALAALVLPVPAPGADSPLAGETIEVAELPGPLPVDPAAAAWDALPATRVLAAPQRSIRLNDRQANAALEAAPLRALAVRAATDGQALAVIVDWSDDTEDRAAPDATDRYGDGVALQWPLRFGAGVRLPYVGMGDEQQPVAVVLQRAAPQGSMVRQARATGFGTLARAELGPLTAAMRYDPQRHAWRALFVRPLAAGGLDLRQGLVPLALAVWDGGRAERGGNKALSGWKFLRLTRFQLDPAYAAEQGWGRGAAPLGDARHGLALFEDACTTCHRAGPQRAAAAGLAPDLSEIGVIATPGYVRDSLRAPSEVIVPNPNPRQHQDRAAKLAPGTPWPPDDAYVWYALEPDGRKTSSMPDYAALPPQDLADLVAYLMTLGAAPAPGRTP